MPIRNDALTCKIGLALLTVLFLADSAPAYIGPGAGLDLIGYTLSLAAWGLTAFSAVLLWPLYAFLHRMRGRAKSLTPPPTPASSEQSRADTNVQP